MCWHEQREGIDTVAILIIMLQNHPALLLNKYFDIFGNIYSLRELDEKIDSILYLYCTCVAEASSWLP